MNIFITYTDDQLLALLKTSNDAAFTELYNRYWDKLFTIACSKLNDAAESEEIVQDIFLAIWNRREELAISSSFSAYLAVSVKYKVINILARRRNQQKYKQQTTEQGDVDHSTEQWLSFEELKDRLAKHVAHLPEKCRIVFLLSREEGLSHKEIAQHVGIAEKTVDAHISKALRVLQTQLRNILSSIF